MKNRKEWFDQRVAEVPEDIMNEVRWSASIIGRIDCILKERNMTQHDLAIKMGVSDAVVSRWTTGLPNLTLRSIAKLSAALGEPLIKVE